MLSKVLKSSIIFSLFLVSTLAHAGGGWTQGKGKTFLKVSEWWINATQHFDPTGKIVSNPKTSYYSTTLYAEYGISDKLTGILYLPALTNASVNFSVGPIDIKESITTIGDADLALKMKLNGPNSKYAIAGTLLLGLPLGNDAGGETKLLQTGDGEFNQMIRVDASRSFSLGESSSLYGNIYAGFNNRTESFSDEIRWGLEIGVGLIKQKLWLAYKMNSIISLKNGSSLTPLDGATLFSNNVEYNSYTIELAYKITDKFGLSVSNGSAFSAKNIYANGTYSVGVFFDL